MSNQQNLCQPPEYPYELLREDIGDFLEQTKRRREIEEIVGDMPIDRLRELVEADRDGRCVVLPVKPGGFVRFARNPREDRNRGCNYHISRRETEWVDRWNEDEAEKYVPVIPTEAALKGEQDG